jgi:hypothetical protein
MMNPRRLGSVSTTRLAGLTRRQDHPMTLAWIVPIVWAMSAFSGVAQAADTVVGIQLYPGSSSSNVEGSEKVLKDTGYRTAVCRHTRDSLVKVVAFYSQDKQLSPLGEPTKDNAAFATRAGGSMSINSPWVDMKTMKFNDGTMICIVHKAVK